MELIMYDQVFILILNYLKILLKIGKCFDFKKIIQINQFYQVNQCNLRSINNRVQLGLISFQFFQENFQFQFINLVLFSSFRLLFIYFLIFLI